MVSVVYFILPGTNLFVDIIKTNGYVSAPVKNRWQGSRWTQKTLKMIIHLQNSWNFVILIYNRGKWTSFFSR